MRFHEKFFSPKGFSTKCFQQNAFEEMQEKYDEEKSWKPRLIILSVGRIARKQLLDISED